MELGFTHWAQPPNRIWEPQLPLYAHGVLNFSGNEAGTWFTNATWWTHFHHLLTNGVSVARIQTKNNVGNKLHAAEANRSPSPGVKTTVFYEAPRFITVFVKAHLLSLSCARCIQSTTSHFISLKFIWILSSHPRLGLPRCHCQVLQPKFCTHFSPTLLVQHAPPTLTSLSWSSL